ncbi:MAG: tRNA uridine-5-carboxymethylaminomethyl(34) synthesis GTPase MnmE [Flavobacteriales bacterium]|nr:tRNA uridine-5-carboxymethylaminomethyl(34) synthesis GTPase MnmE [Flavobacteriales bacterium]MBK6945383.1 tRNA uridine-5-carboxymethylaminomethyl(34) synthesis GTPase MnmE [Flavobacteriales bacterium]MBK7241497.1 tRNA uridine-5-carboxymethylaminomethyl(34) synthesis GTPase MnmE [Flavobacteriales bacterium]MBK9535058.1 tRNA uridine-5-carboxymethylaminomethyl(34) synthesis GTPase MnmE [Flavobacteriales bacterium]MBP9139588.1 tRNA uridine-5-carboxymethylaminomethyl(34) synthesis GTPase MnmE [F
MYEQDTIAALSTPAGAGAIAMLRVSGAKATAVIDRIAPTLPLEPLPRSAYYVPVIDMDGQIDEAVITYFKGPHSYTGEDVVEVCVHGSTYIQQRLLQAMLDAGARLAQPGEFTQRAFLNKKLDLSQAEAVADLIASQSAAQHELALHQLRGGFGNRIEELRQQLIDFCALIELELDFGEEDVEFAQRIELVALVDRLIDLCTELVDSFRYGNAIKQGIPVAILGAPNSGKSTLLNALLQEDRAIVSEIAGTTRDTVEELLSIEGILFRIIDTAGLRRTTDVVEKLGIDRSYKKAAESSIVILLGDGSKLSEGALRTEAKMLQERLSSGVKVVPMMNKSDINASTRSSTILSISARTGEGLDALKQILLQHVKSLQSGSGDIVVTNARHVDALTKARSALEDAKKAIDNGISGELLAIDLRRAQHHLGEITGRITTDDLLGSIFGKFCIGK